MFRTGRLGLALILASLAAVPYAYAAQEQAEPFRPPAIPLVTHHPYFSVWSTSDRPTDDWSRHWTGSIQALCGLVRIDDRPYRVLGSAPVDVPAMALKSTRVTPTRTIFDFEAGGAAITLTFTSPLLPHDLDVLARPVTYVDWEARSIDGKPHSAAVYLDGTAEWAVDKPNQRVVWSRGKAGGLDVLKIGSQEQKVLNRAGDNLRIDWGYFSLSVPEGPSTRTSLASDRSAREAFARTGKLPAEDDLRMPRQADAEWPVMAASVVLDASAGNSASAHMLLAYDETYAVELLKARLRPYWRRNGLDLEGLLQVAEGDHAKILDRCREFDRAFTADLEKAGGPQYAALCTLAYRQAIAAHGLAADEKGRLLMFAKENFSNGCIATVDVIYPAAPLFLLVSPAMLRAQLLPVLDYAMSGRWKFPFAPHDLGTYPLANGQVYGGGERTEKDQMPVEESGNMLILLAALARAEGNAEFSRPYWPILARWAAYLREKGLDPENQLCTDDFAGHLAHNTNLSLKAILALGSYAQLAQQLGQAEEARSYRELAAGMAAKWPAMAEDGDHYRLAFDRPGTWSQKYNLVWDRLLGLGLFPAEIARKEIAFYLKHQNEFGLPLDNRSKYTKLDWLVWTATLAEERADFETILAPAYRFAQQSPSRVPLTDWYWTHDAKQRGFQARSVVGGLFIKLLADPEVWKKWSTP